MNYTIANIGFFLCLLSLNTWGQFECESVPTEMNIPSLEAEVISIDYISEKDQTLGKISWKDGSVYEGKIKNKIMDGMGTLVFSDQSRYRGQFKNGEMHGVGMMTYNNKFKYDGEWISGKKEGSGALTFPCGLEYLGYFKNDQMHGEGVLRINKNETFVGVWSEGKVVGNGTHFRSDGSKFIGTYKSGEQHGEGMIVWETKDTLKGIWKNGLLENHGSFQFADGSIMHQTWENGKLTKEVIYIQKNGFYLSGTPQKVIEQLTQSKLNQSDGVGDNFSLAWYISAMECKGRQDFEGAAQQLKYAQIFQNPMEDSQLAELLNEELKIINVEKEKLGVAKKNKNINRQ